MTMLVDLVAFALALMLVSLVWHFSNSEVNPVMAKRAGEFIRQAKSEPLNHGQTEQQVAVRLALAAGNGAVAAIVYKRLYGGTLFEAREAVNRLVRTRILTS